MEAHSIKTKRNKQKNNLKIHEDWCEFVRIVRIIFLTIFQQQHSIRIRLSIHHLLRGREREKRRVGE